MGILRNLFIEQNKFKWVSSICVYYSLLKLKTEFIFSVIARTKYEHMLSLFLTLSRRSKLWTPRFHFPDFSLRVKFQSESDCVRAGCVRSHADSDRLMQSNERIQCGLQNAKYLHGWHKRLRGYPARGPPVSPFVSSHRRQLLLLIF